MNQHNMLTMKEAAEHIGCSVSFIRTSTASGKLAHYKIGRRFFYTPEDLSGLIKRVEPQTNDNNFEL